MALFSYKTGVWPISLEIAGARLSLNQDGSVGLMLGATEIGQGADTVFSQMTAEVLNMDISDIHIQTVQDTDVTPFDTGAYASRQSFVTGTVVKDCANLLKEKILAYAKELLPEETRKLRLDHGWIMAGKIQRFGLARKKYKICAVCAVGMGQTGTQRKEIREKNNIPGKIPVFTLQ